MSHEEGVELLVIINHRSHDLLLLFTSADSPIDILQ